MEPDFNSNTHPSLLRTMSTPRRCGTCHMIMMPKPNIGKHHCCRNRCHKKSVKRPHKRTCSTTHVYPGEEHWTKVLQANEVNANVTNVTSRSSQSEAGPVGGSDKGVKVTRDERGILTNLYSRICQWVSSARRNAVANRAVHTERTRPLLDKSTSCSGGIGPVECAQCAGVGVELGLAWDDSQLDRLCQCAASSDCESDLTRTSSSTTSDTPHLLAPPTDLLSTQYAANRDEKNSHSSLTNCHSCPPPQLAKQASLSRPQGTRLFLCSTWPPSGKNISFTDACVDEEEEDEQDDCQGQISPKQDATAHALGDCTIPYSDLQFGECIRVGRTRSKHRGRWHGEVIIHLYSSRAEEEAAQFWSDVKKLSMIRHENIVLFMGACVQPPHLAIVTSVRQGCTLYEHIHLKGEKMSQNTKLSWARQIAQGMGYLHARGVIMRKLNSRNIVLEPKVKLCLLDQSMAETKHDRENYGCVPRGHLTYIAPEMMISLKFVCPRLKPTHPYTFTTDVFAFGTVLYELVAGQFPLAGSPTQTVIWSTVTARRHSPPTLNCSPSLKQLIEMCWALSAADRPQFHQITKHLHQNVGLHKRHSSSEPEKLNKSGINRNVHTNAFH